ncbi:putative ribonuclease H-like domain-containing protein [Tanacetum coccineum]
MYGGGRMKRNEVEKRGHQEPGSTALYQAALLQPGDKSSCRTASFTTKNLYFLILRISFPFESCLVGNPQMDLQDQGVIDSGCSRHMTGNMSYLTYYEEIDGGYVAFGGTPKEGKSLEKAPLKLLIDESQVLLRVPRKNNMYGVNLKKIVPKGGLTCLFAKVTSDESKLWHGRLGHLNIKTMNKLVKGNLVRGLPSKLFENDQTCIACQKGMQHIASCKSKTENSISLPLHLLYMDLFGLIFVKSLMKKMYCLVVTDDFSRFIWGFFLATKDETSGILKSFITRIENLVDHKVKVISVARTPQQNGVAERRNMTLIKAARTMLADSKLPTTFWAEAVNTACYVQNRVLVVKPHNKTPYELFHGRTPTLSFMRPFRCHVTIINTIYHLGKFNGKADEGFFVGYSLNSKAFRVFNSRTRIVEENLHIRFSENTPNVVGSGPDWLFDIDALTRTMNYEPIVPGTQSNGFVGTKASDNAGQVRKETEPDKDYILLPLWTADPPYSQYPNSSHDDGSKPSSDDGKKVNKDPRKDNECNNQEKEDNVNSTNTVNAAGTNEINDVGGKTSIELSFDPCMHASEDYSIFNSSRDDEDDGAEADMNNLDTTIQVSPIPITRIHKDHRLDQVIGDLKSATQIRQMSKKLEEHGFVSTIQQRTNHKDLQNCLFACFLSQEEPKKVIHTLKDSSWIEAIQEELLQFKLQEILTLVDLPNGKRAIGTKWVFRNKKDERGIVIRNKARLVAQGFQREKIDKTLFIKRKKGDILLVQVYVDDFILGSTKKELCNAFEKLMHEKFQMSSMGELTLFLGLQVQQKKDGMSIIGSLMYLTSSRLDIIFEVCACARYQVNPKVSHLNAVKMIFRLISWQCKKQTVVANSTTEASMWLLQVVVDKSFGLRIILHIMGKAKKSVRLMMEKLFGMELELILAKTINGEVQLHALVDEQEVVAKGVNLTVDEVTLAQALAALKSVKSKIKVDVIKEHNIPVSTASASTKVSVANAPTKISAATTTTGTIPTPRKGIVINELGTPTITRSSQQPSQKKSSEQRQRENAKVNADYQLAERLQAEEQEYVIIEEKATLFQELLEQIRKHFAAKRAEEKRNKPPTKTQQKKSMITYLKNMEELEQASTKKQKVDDDKETTELKQCLEIIPDEEDVTIDAIPLAVKSPRIVDWKIHKEGKKCYYQIVRADGKSYMYMIFSRMLKSFDREDLEDLYKLIKARYGSTRPVEDLDLSTFLKDATYADLHVGREEVSTCTTYTFIDGRIVGIKSLLNAAIITVALIDVNATQSKLYKVNAAEGVNAASEEVSTANFSLGPSTSPSSSSGSAPSIEKAECSNFKLLSPKIKILKATQYMERHPKDHTFLFSKDFEMKIFPMLTLLVLVLVLTCMVEDSKATTVENATPKDTTQHPLEHLHKGKEGVPPPPPPTYKCVLAPEARKSYCCYVNDALAPNKVLFSKDFEMKIFSMLTLLVLVLVLTCMVQDSKATTVENATDSKATTVENATPKVLFSKDFEMKIFPMLTLLVLVLVLTCMVEDSKSTIMENGTLKDTTQRPLEHLHKGSKVVSSPPPSMFKCPPDSDRKHFCCYVDGKLMRTCGETHEECMKKCAALIQ